jgi:hypothetical protein
MAASPSENPFQVIDNKFARAYGFGQADISVHALGPLEFIGGTTPEGGHVGILRPTLKSSGIADTFTVHDAPPITEDALPEDPEDEGTRQYLIGGDEDQPTGHEVISSEPLITRELCEEEMAELARKIGGTTFFPYITPTQS